MQVLISIVAVFSVLFIVWKQCSSDKSYKECDSFSEIDGFNVEDNVLNDHGMQEFEGGEIMRLDIKMSGCRTKIFTENMLTSNMFINELDTNETLRFHGREVDLRTKISDKPIERLLAHASLKRCGRPGLFLTTTLTFSSQTNTRILITAVKARNISMQQKGYARISSGGVLQDHVGLQLRSEKGGGFVYEVSVYGIINCDYCFSNRAPK